MTSPRTFVRRTSAKRAADAQHLSEVEAYGSPRKVWVEDGHVFVESYDGEIVSMTPEVAIKVGRTLSDAGAESLINRVMEEADDSLTRQRSTGLKSEKTG